MKNPRRNILLATVGTCLIIGVLSSVEVYAAQLVWPAAEAYPSIDTAYTHIARRAGGQTLFQVMGITLIVATVGSDAAGDRIAAMLREFGIASEGLLRIDRPTTRKTRIVARSQQMVRVDEEDDSDLSAAELARVIAAIEDALPSVDAVILEDYNKGVLVPAVITRTIAGARARGVPVVVDPKYRHFFAYRGATVFKPNRRELDSALGAEIDVEHPEAIPMAMERLDVEHLLLTLGERGMMLASRKGPPKSVPTSAREVYDVVGAGDTVTAYLAAVLAAGGTVEEASVIANYAAGVEVGKLGAATVTPDEVVQAFDDHATSARS